MRKFLTIAAVLPYLFAATPKSYAAADDAIFQQAINYVFTGTVDPKEAPEIVNPASCIVVMRDPKFNRYIRYYLNRFKMDSALTTKKYSGTQTLYELDVEGDDVIVEYLDPGKTTVTQAFKSAQIPLPGNIDRTQKALQIIFADHCKADQLKTPF